MKFRIEFVATASKGATGKLRKTANLKLVIHKTGYNRESKSLRNSVKIEEWDKNRERVKSSSTNAGVLNLFLNATEQKLIAQIYSWERDNINWTPKQLIEIFYSKHETPQQTKADTVVPISTGKYQLTNQRNELRMEKRQ